MNCLKCKCELSPIEVRDILVLLCNDCGGSWLSRKDFICAKESGNVILDELYKNIEETESLIENDKRLKCPVCPDIILMRHFSSMKKQVEVDECPLCGGYWLDAGELEVILQEYKEEKFLKEVKKREKYNFSYVREKEEKWRKEDQRRVEENRTSTYGGGSWFDDPWWMR